MLTIQLEGNEGDAGYIEYSAEGISMSRVVITLQAATGNDDKRVTEEDAVSTEPDNGPQVLFEDDNTTYILVLLREIAFLALTVAVI